MPDVKIFEPATSAKTHSSWQGVDSVFFIDNEKQGAIQDFDIRTDHKLKRSLLDMSVLLLDTLEYPTWATDGLDHELKVSCHNEYGKNAELTLGRFRCISSRWGIHINDVVVERNYTFEQVIY